MPSRNESQQHMNFLCRLQHYSSFQFLFPFHIYFLLFHTLLIKPVTRVYVHAKHSEAYTHLSHISIRILTSYTSVAYT